MVGEGLRKYFPHFKSLIVIPDGGSTDDSRERAEGVQLPPGIEKLVTIYRGLLPGKGSSLRAVLETSEMLGPRVVVMIDGDLENIGPKWIRLLAEPILEYKYDFATPFYQRHKYDATITRLIAYPLTRAIFRKRVHQPIGGEFGFSGKVAKYFAQQDVWDTDVSKFGIDIWLTINAIEKGLRICQSRLGAKIHRERDPIDLGDMFREVTGTIFALMQMYEKEWLKLEKSKKVDYFGDWQEVEAQPVSTSISELIDKTCVGYEHFYPLWNQILSKEASLGLRDICPSSPQKFTFPDDLWVKIVYDFAVSYKNWQSDKQKLVSMMTPLYYGRVAAFFIQVENLDAAGAEKVVEEQAQVFEDLKPYLVGRASGKIS